jgi:hypothetical protein
MVGKRLLGREKALIDRPMVSCLRAYALTLALECYEYGVIIITILQPDLDFGLVEIACR